MTEVGFKWVSEGLYRPRLHTFMSTLNNLLEIYLDVETVSYLLGFIHTAHTHIKYMISFIHLLISVSIDVSSYSLFYIQCYKKYPKVLNLIVNVLPYQKYNVNVYYVYVYTVYYGSTGYRPVQYLVFFDFWIQWVFVCFVLLFFSVRLSDLFPLWLRRSSGHPLIERFVVWVEKRPWARYQIPPSVTLSVFECAYEWLVVLMSRWCLAGSLCH